MSIQPGPRVGAYEVGDLLGRGAMGAVYRGWHEGLQRAVAIKVLQTIAEDEEAVARFRLEARTIAQLRHPNILNVFDFGEVNGVPYMVVELVPGGSLGDRMKAGGVERAAALDILRGVAAALDHAHSRGVVHRDIKPDNILLAEDGAPIVADFGLAKLAQSAVRSMTGTVTGTPVYMAPEQATGGTIGPATDRYALAVVAQSVLTGRPPFDRDDLMQLLYAHVHEAPQAAGLGDDADAVLRRGLAKDPTERWPSCASMVEALAVALGGASSGVDLEATVLFSSTAAIAPPPVVPAVSTSPPQTAPPAVPLGQSLPPAQVSGGGGGAVATLLRMGVRPLATDERFSLNSHFANAVHVARQVCGPAWPAVAAAAGLPQYTVDDPPSDESRTTPVEYLSTITSAFEQAFGSGAPEQLRRWGRQATDRSLQLRKSAATERRAFRLIPGQQRKLVVLLKSFTKSMDEVRGAHTHTYKQIDDERFWLVHFANLYALGRRTDERACHVWTASFEAMLRWCGLANRWLVEEIECGCVTGTWNCVFAICASSTED